MSFERLEQYLRELKAIKEYGPVRAERDELRAKARLQGQEIDALRSAIENLRASDEKGQRDLATRTEELRLSRAENERLKEVNKILRETKLIVGDKELTLPRIKELLTEAKTEEIKSRAAQVFEKLKEEWELKQKPAEVTGEAVSTLQKIICTLSRPEPRFFVQEEVDLGLPQDVERLISSEVNRRVDELEWPKWYDEVVRPKVVQLEASLRASALDQLKGDWTMRCGKCGTLFKFELGSEHVANLLRLGHVRVACSNLQCVDELFFFRPRHSSSVTLVELIESRIASEGKRVVYASAKK